MGLRSLFSRPGAPPAFRRRPGAEQPDIVLFLTDEQRHDELGYSSGGHFETPSLDALASRGVVFDQAYSSSTVCVPSRASLLTGLSYHRVPLREGSLALRPGCWTVARALRDAGYETALVGKMHFFPMYARHGFDTMRLAEHLVPFSGYEVGEIDDYHRFLLWQGRADARATHMFGPAQEALARDYEANFSAVKFPHHESLHPIGWIASEARRVVEARDARPERKPLFLVVSFPRPHTPYDPAEPYASMYDPASARLPADGFPVNDHLPEPFRTAFEQEGRQRHRPQTVSSMPEATFRRILTYVRALVRQIDGAVGRVVERLDLDRSVVFMTSDHGTYAGHRGLLGKVPWIPFDDLARVPFFCAAPDAAPGRRVSSPVQSHDFALTCLDYAGVEPPPGVFETESLRSIVRGGDARADRAVFTGANMGWPMVRKGPLKLLQKVWTEHEVLYDLADDPGETRDRIADPTYAARLEALRTELRRFQLLEIPALPDLGRDG